MIYVIHGNKIIFIVIVIVIVKGPHYWPGGIHPWPMDSDDSQWYVAWVLQARNMRHMSANRQWKVVDERDSGNIFVNYDWYSTHISHIVRVRTTQTTQ